jgi:hypothetical protein
MWTGFEIVIVGPTTGLDNLFGYVTGLIGGALKSWETGPKTWEVFDDANVDDFDISVDEYGTKSGIYKAAFPTDIPEGKYLFAVCQGTVTEGGFTVPTALEINWTGSAESSTFEMLNADVEWNIVTDPNQAKKILKQAGTETILLTKNLEQPDGSPVTSTNQLVGKEVKPS